MATRKNSRGFGIEVEVILSLALLLIGLGWLIGEKPFTLDAQSDDAVLASPPEGEPGADVLVVLPTVPEAQSFEQLSTDQAWLTTVERELGTVRVVESSQLTRSVMDPCAWVIIPRSAASMLDPTQTQFVRNWVQDGGTVILEQPEGPWRGLIGQPLSRARARETRRITSFDGALTRGEVRADILEMPLQTTLIPYNPPQLARGRDYQVLMEVDGQPGIVTLHIGRGRLLLLLFDFGRVAVRTMQGVPEPDFSVVPQLEPGAAHPSTSDLIADESLRTSHIPFVDLLERNILYLADTHRPVGRLWHYPATRRGAVLVGHGEAGYGAAAAYMTNWEHSEERRSTLFAVAQSLSPEALARMGRLSIDVGLHWAPSDHPVVPYGSWGVRGFRPVRRPMSMLAQLDGLNHDLIPYGPLMVSRSVDGVWSDGYFDAFRTLEAGGLLLDASYGPPPARLSGETEYFGYVFGTGLPFRPLDRSGDRFTIQEMPVSIDASSSGYSLSRVRQLIVDSSESYHTTLATNWRPDMMADRPSFDAIEGWQRAFVLAESQELWVSTYTEYADFLARRNASHVESTFSREERRLTIELRLVGPTGASRPEDEEDAAVLAQDTPGVAFPTRFEGRPVERLIVDNVSTPLSVLSLTGDRVLHILEMPPGEHRVQVIYGSPIDSGTPE